MNRLDKVLLATGVAVTLLGVIGAQSFGYQYYLEQVSGDKLPIGLLGWMVATYGPLLAAALFWRLSKHVAAPLALLMLVLFVPCAILLVRLGDTLMLDAIQDPDFDAIIGGPDFPADISLTVAVVGYVVALVTRFRSRQTVRPAAKS